MSCGIYKITNKENNKIYIGQSINIEERWREHLRESLIAQDKWEANKRKEQTHLHRAMRQYQTKENIKQNFSFEIIELCKEEQLNERERYWIAIFDSYANGYNMTYGGDGYRVNSSDAPNTKLTLDQVSFIREKLKNRWTADQIIEALSPQVCITNTTISDINYGKTWFDPSVNYPISINNGHRLWSNEQALSIKQEWARGANISELAEKYGVSTNTISDLINGKSYQNLPKIERQVNYKRTNTKVRKFSQEEVENWRRLHYQEKRSILSLKEEAQVQCTYAAFYNMIKGITYKNYGGIPNGKV